MNPLSPIPILLVLVLAIFTAFCLNKLFGTPLIENRISTIDGLRGYLALSVFISHSFNWYLDLRLEQWGSVRPSRTYVYLGQASVVLFFMITGFLFFSKLLEGRTKGIDWGRLFISRVLRLAPLYAFAMCVLFMIVVILSDWTVKVPLSSLALDAMKWLGFSIAGTPDLNGVANTWEIISGVIWTLPYELYFYMILPLIGLLIGVKNKPTLKYIIVSCISIFLMFFYQIRPIHFLSFIGGAAAAYLIRFEVIRQFSNRNIASFIVVAAIFGTAMLSKSTYRFGPIMCLFIAFVLIACGNSLFGILNWTASKTLGEMAYSIYLLHGLFLFITFNFVLDLKTSRELSITSHWGVILLLTPVLVCMSYLTFTYIESYSMRQTTKVLNWLRSVKVVMKNVFLRH